MAESNSKTEISGTRPCDGLRVDLKRCLLQSDCCLKSKKTPLECLQTNEVVITILNISNGYCLNTNYYNEIKMLMDLKLSRLIKRML